MITLCFVIPIKNEILNRDNIARMVNQIHLLANESTKPQIWLVDDQSTDGTIQHLMDIVSSRALVIPNKLGGVLGALKSLPSTTSFDYITVLPADSQIDSAALNSLVLLLNQTTAEFDCIYLKKSYTDKRMWFRFYSWMQNEILLQRLGIATWNNGMTLSGLALNKILKKDLGLFMHDVKISQFLKSMTAKTIVIESQPGITVSARKYHSDGTIFRTRVNLLVILLFIFNYRNEQKLLRLYQSGKVSSLF